MASRGAGTAGLWLCDETIDLELGGLNDEIHPIRDSDGIVEGEEILGKVHEKGLSNMASKDASNGGGDTEEAQLGGIIGVFMKAK